MTRPFLRNVLVRGAGAACLFACLWAASASAASLADKARENACARKPTQVAGATETYKCETASGVTAYFNVGGVSPSSSSARLPTPAGFPKVDAGTQKGRDIVRQKVLSDELATEEKLLAEARGAYGDGTPPPRPDEKANAQKYADRLARLRQTVALHEKNIEALKRELAASR